MTCFLCAKLWLPLSLRRWSTKQTSRTLKRLEDFEKTWKAKTSKAQKGVVARGHLQTFCGKVLRCSWAAQMWLIGPEVSCRTNAKNMLESHIHHSVWCSVFGPHFNDFWCVPICPGWSKCRQGSLTVRRFIHVSLTTWLCTLQGEMLYCFQAAYSGCVLNR